MEVGDRNELVMNYWIINYYEVAKKLHKKLDTGEYEMLWSEPTNGPNASPIPVIIQQDKRKLFDLRFDTGYYDDIIG